MLSIQVHISPVGNTQNDLKDKIPYREISCICILKKKNEVSSYFFFFFHIFQKNCTSDTVLVCKAMQNNTFFLRDKNSSPQIIRKKFPFRFFPN